MIIGAARCGTTSLYACLREHPQVFLSPEKETDDFSVGDLSPDEVPALAATWRARTRDEDERWRSDRSMRFTYVRASLYHDGLAEFFRRFPRDRILVLPFEELAADTVGTMRRSYEFLGAPRLVTQLGNVIMRPPPDIATDGRARLLPRFVDDVRRLEDLLARDLGTWRSV